MVESMAAFGFDRWLSATENPHSIMPGPSMLHNGQSIEWLCVYTVKRYADIDPIVSHCRNEVMPLFWDPKIGWENSDPKVQGFMKDVVKHGFGSGLALPLKQEGVPNGLFSITSDQSLEIERSHYEEVLPRLQKVAITTHEIFHRIYAQSKFRRY